MRIHFLYGTETGTSELVCEDIEAELEGFECQISPMADVTPTDLDADTLYIFVTSTYGTGDLPSSAQPFYEALEGFDLSHVRFAIFGLGDMVFSDTFAFGSKILMERLLACKAHMIGERGIHDASSPDMPEDIAVPWAQGIVTELRAKAA